jgi:UDP:flavonoid glycosyltransferase YjiC (YdhE family)
MKVLLASSPIIGHVNPIIVAARVLKNAGHTVAIYTGCLFREKIESAGIQFFALPEDVDFDMRDIGATFPEWLELSGLPQLRYGMKAAFVDSIPSQFRGLRAVLRDYPPDLIVYETSFCGILPLLLGPPSLRPPCAYLGISTSQLPREDGAPWGSGLPPATSAAQAEKYAAAAKDFDRELTNPVREHADRTLHAMGVEPLPAPLFESMATLADVIVQPCVPGFEYPVREQGNVHFIGAMIPEGAGDTPAWVKEAKRAGKKVILVSQGTIANDDLGKLLAPAIQAFGDREDFLILVTTGGKPLEMIPCPLTNNTIASRFLNFREILPDVDVLVAFASYGTVTQALSFGVPMVVAGMGEDKPEVGARVAWTESGIYLRTDKPSVKEVREAVDQILSSGKYRVRAKALSEEFATYDAAHELPLALEQLVDEELALAG